MSIVGGSRIAGEIASVRLAARPTTKVVFLLLLLAGFNLFIGAFNFIPLLPLDGGHIAGALWEAHPPRLRPAARPARPGLRRRREAAAGRLRGGAVMLVMSVVLIVGDIVVPIHITA